ncbi:hypothetical protein GALMADRAFT_221128 [Galerina marginata CBS 339.88]|uniref:F-box domain-containing protein n=1 Tax=Galerina marginata (strain CBS 339.88) TaxID=685588 RepID=A0A067TTE7_GALM3|nr:hypothetical protein GALMADRAFT_221128 [Galerina marginata CBS 339.88]
MACPTSILSHPPSWSNHSSTQMSTQLQIPVELLELIVANVDLLTSDRRQTLVACSYANRTLTAMCQKHIFRDIQIRQKVDRVSEGTIFTEDQGADGERFLALIKSPKSRHLAAYVRNLAINVVHELSYGYVNYKPDPNCHSSLKPDFPLYDITTRLPNLKRFAVLSSIGRTFTEWDTLHKRIQTFFSDLVQRLPEIDLRFFEDMLVSTFYNCPALEVLHVSAFHTTEIIPSCRSRLKFLDIGYDSPGLIKGAYFLNHFDPVYSPLDVTHLTGLKLASIEFLASDVNKILALCANTLESLDLEVGVYGEYQLSYTRESPQQHSNSTLPNLGMLQNLRNLTLRSSIRGSPVSLLSEAENFYESNTPSVSAILQTLPLKLHSPFELLVDTLVQGFPMDRLSIFPWSELVNVLQEVRFSHISTLVKFIFREWQNSNYKEGNKLLDSNRLSEMLDQNDDLGKLGKKNICFMATSRLDYN